MYCPKEKEETMIASCKANIRKEILQDAFTLTFSRMKKYQGSWHREKCSLFPNYIFLESSREEELFREMEPYRGIAKLQEKDGHLLAVSRDEELFLHAVSGSEHHIGMSRGYIRDGQTYVTEGPLAGYEKYIRHIDRHKRLARLELPMNRQQIELGLEIYAKD